MFLSTPEFSPEEYQNAYIALIIFVILIVFVRRFMRNLFDENLIRLKTKIDPSYKSAQLSPILEKYFPYYKQLEPRIKRKFIRRLEMFMEMKTFIPRQMKNHKTVNVLVGATAVQLSFGFDTFAFFSFKRILVYPDNYYSNIRQVYHQGEVNVPNRLIVLSAKHVLSGILETNDGVNLGLHEMAHAMHVEAFESGNKSFIKSFKIWEQLAIIEQQKMLNDSQHFLREYAQESIPEMFAVCVENFFERPKSFEQSLPELYKQMAIILNQDPLHEASPVL